ncbi:MAG: ATP-binding protein [Planctomycetes bacterium]|nr:ATP-binding protein [Planctomycetota bacterium]
MASRGIGLLITNGKKLKNVGHSMVLLNPRGIVESVLKTSRVDKMFPFAYDLDEAIRILRGAQGQSDAASPQLKAETDESTSQQSISAAPARPPREGELRLAIKNEVAELKGLSARVTDFLDAHHVPHRAAYAVHLVVDELVTNVMRYAYVDYNTHYIDMELVILRDQIILRIVDDGRPFDPRSGPALDLHAEDREAGGLGLLLVLDMVDTLNYRRAEEKNHVEVRIRVLTNDESAALSSEGGTASTTSGE